jgi:hypothetical protein
MMHSDTRELSETLIIQGVLFPVEDRWGMYLTKKATHVDGSKLIDALSRGLDRLERILNAIPSSDRHAIRFDIHLDDEGKVRAHLIQEEA